MEFSKENLKLVFVPLRCLLTFSICPKVVYVCVRERERVVSVTEIEQLRSERVTVRMEGGGGGVWMRIE